jgi:hypothetical protein
LGERRPGDQGGNKPADKKGSHVSCPPSLQRMRWLERNFSASPAETLMWQSKNHRRDEIMA